MRRSRDRGKQRGRENRERERGREREERQREQREGERERTRKKRERKKQRERGQQTSNNQFSATECISIEGRVKAHPCAAPFQACVHSSHYQIRFMEIVSVLAFPSARHPHEKNSNSETLSAQACPSAEHL